MLHYIRVNIWNMIKHEKWFTFTIIMTQAISVLVALFASGMIYNFTIKEKAMEGTMFVIYIDEDDGTIVGDIAAEEVKNEYVNIFNLMDKKMEEISYIFSVDDPICQNTRVLSRACYDVKNKTLTRNEIYNEFEKRMGGSGRMFTDEEQEEGANVVVIFGDYLKEEKENGVNIGETNYKVLGIVDPCFRIEMDETCSRDFLVPIKVVPDKLRLTSITLKTSSVINEREYARLAEYFENKYNGRIIMPKFEGVRDIENLRANRTFVIAGIGVLFCAVLNFCILYRVILEKRKKTMAVYRICGCSKRTGMMMYEIELLGVALIVFVLFTLLYHRYAMKYFDGILEYMPEFYTKTTYLIMGAIYFGILIIMYTILVVGMVRKTPTTLSKEGAL